MCISISIADYRHFVLEPTFFEYALDVFWKMAVRLFCGTELECIHLSRYASLPQERNAEIHKHCYVLTLGCRSAAVPREGDGEPFEDRMKHSVLLRGQRTEDMRPNAADSKALESGSDCP